MCSQFLPAFVFLVSFQNSHVTAVDKELKSLIEGVRLKNGEVARDLFCLVTPGPVDSAPSLGKYTLQWKRLVQLILLT
ncbi:unnamed protein product [Ixodes pacificus]